MKRLAWLFLALFCTALAQVPRVELPVAPHETCDCCEQPGACGMPECGLPPAAMPTVFSAERPVTVARPTVAKETARVFTAAPDFWVAVLEPVVVPVPRRVLIDPSPPPVPLFKAHCAFLI